MNQRLLHCSKHRCLQKVRKRYVLAKSRFTGETANSILVTSRFVFVSGTEIHIIIPYGSILTASRHCVCNLMQQTRRPVST